MRSGMKWKTIDSTDNANLLSKHFQARITIYDNKIFFVGQPQRLTFFQGIFAKEHWIPNFNPEMKLLGMKLS